jgi:DNA-binding Xre family transcriptional regulator
MPAKTKNGQSAEQVFLLDRSRTRRRRFSPLHPRVISSLAELRESVEHANRDTLWISYEKQLTEALLRSLAWPTPSLGKAVLVHAASPQTLAVLARCFHRFAFGGDASFLPPDELAAALQAENRDDLFLGASVDPATRTITLWRGNLDSLTVPFSAFETSGDGLKPDFEHISVRDFGQTIRLGTYEAAAEALLYEYDPDYRRRIAKQRRETEQSLGASIRRLRKERGLRRQDFAPEVASKTIARIEQGRIQSVRARTLEAIARRLRVAPEELGTF